jgi:hypothetical protein
MYHLIAEVWLAQRDEFIFRVRESDTGTKWTFRVPRTTLDILDPTGKMAAQAIFDLHRPAIYSEARRLLSSGDSWQQQTISMVEVLARVPPDGGTVTGTGIDGAAADVTAGHVALRR